jgi:hypothetical protein
MRSNQKAAGILNQKVAGIFALRLGFEKFTVMKCAAPGELS